MPKVNCAKKPITNTGIEITIRVLISTRLSQNHAVEALQDARADADDDLDDDRDERQSGR
ncbi:MAG: hypothetical protein H6527_01015 [Actinobacteria bacterium]|nr:hypothetical protein [Actinomycetota bacterium]